MTVSGIGSHDIGVVGPRASPDAMKECRVRAYLADPVISGPGAEN